MMTVCASIAALIQPSTIGSTGAYLLNMPSRCRPVPMPHFISKGAKMKPVKFATIMLALALLAIASMVVAGMFLTTVAASATSYGV